MVNTEVLNLSSRRNLSFDWLDVLRASPHFTQNPNDPEQWTYNTTQITASALYISLPEFSGSEFCDDGLVAVLSLEASKRYDCKVDIELGWFGSDNIRVVFRDLDYKPPRSVFFGNYPQWGQGKQPIEWLVLKQTGTTALLISKYGIHTTGYWMGERWEGTQENLRSLIWEYSDLRQWLNHDFLKMAFSPVELQSVLNTAVITQDDLDATDQLDKIFLLSEEELLRYLPTHTERQAQSTVFAQKNDACVGLGGTKTPKNSCCWWILPEATDDYCYPKAVFGNGYIHFHGRNIWHSDFCVRPAVRVKVSALKEKTESTNPEQESNPCERIALDDDNLYYMTVHYTGDSVSKISIDKETANDSHYTVENAAANQLLRYLKPITGADTLQGALRVFFKTKSDYDLVMLMKQKHIPFKEFHFDDY